MGETNISRLVDVYGDTAKCDESVKAVLADKQITAWILINTLREFEGLEPDCVRDLLGLSYVGKIDIEPGRMNLGIVEKLSEESMIKDEGKIVFDVLFRVMKPVANVSMIIDFEGQRNSRASDLGYEIDNRMIYYLGRLISIQKNVEFSHSDYDGLKDVRSIWICMDAKDDEASISRINLVEECIYGKRIGLRNLGKVQGVVIRIRKNTRAKKSGNRLIAMLEVLFGDKPAEDKKEVLNREYGIIMDDGLERRVEKMCNFSEVFFERGWDKGREEGREEGLDEGITIGIDEGIVKGKEEVAIELLIRGASAETVSAITKIPMERLEELSVK